MTMITGPDIPLFHLLVWKGALKLEILGLQRSRRPSVYSIVKRQLGFRGDRTSVYAQLEAHIAECKAAREGV